MREPMLAPEAFRHFESTAHDRIADSYQTFFEPVTQHAIHSRQTTAMQQHIHAVFERLDICCINSLPVPEGVGLKPHLQCPQ
jgi:hypothetical protein